jgi:hypothetical protein
MKLGSLSSSIPRRESSVAKKKIILFFNKLKREISLIIHENWWCNRIHATA